MKINRDKLAKVAKIVICLHDEDFDPIDSFGYDTDEENESAAREVRELAKRTPWGWCCVEVRATYGGLSGRDFLGGCSYASEREFRESGYYDDMVSTALDELARELESVAHYVSEICEA